MTQGREKQFFAGGVTPQGFVNFFEDIVGEEERELYILKGGPGTGKSRMLKKIARAARAEGYDVEVVRCSADPDSLDGVRIPDLGKTVLDGTAPHVVDMTLPGARDCILNLGDFWDEDCLRRHKKEIASLDKEQTICFQRASHYLKAAKEIQNNIDQVADRALLGGKMQQFAKQLCQRFFGDMDVSYRPGTVRRRFGTAITAKGVINSLPSLFQGVKVYALRCDYGKASAHILDQLQTEALQRGFCVESYRCPMSPDCTEHLVIPKLSLAFTTYNAYHMVLDCQVFGEYPLDVYYNDFAAEPYLQDLEYDRFRMQELLDKAQGSLGKALQLHRIVEGYYTESMDFSAIDHCTERVLERVLE